MKEQWQQLAARFAALQVRERILILVAAVVGFALIYDALFVESLAARDRRLIRQLAEAREGIKTAQTLLKAQQALADPDAARRSYRDALRKQLGEIDDRMQGLQHGLVPPERMSKLLEEMLARTRGLQLVSLRTLPVERYDAARAAASAAKKDATGTAREPERSIYQHGVEISLQGSYADLHEYLARLEKLEWQMFWGRISVNTEQYPRLGVTLTVRTLSLSRAWLVV